MRDPTLGTARTSCHCDRYEFRRLERPEPRASAIDTRSNAGNGSNWAALRETLRELRGTARDLARSAWNGWNCGLRGLGLLFGVGGPGFEELLFAIDQGIDVVGG